MRMKTWGKPAMQNLILTRLAWVKMCRFDFLTRKRILKEFEQNKFENLSQPYWGALYTFERKFNKYCRERETERETHTHRERQRQRERQRETETDLRKKVGKRGKGKLISKFLIEQSYRGFKKISCIDCLLLKFSFGDKKQCLLKVLITFIRWLLNSFDLPSYGSELKKRYTKIAVDVSRGVESLGSCSAWEGAND